MTHLSPSGAPLGRSRQATPVDPDSLALPWWARVLIGMAGGGLGGIAIWALMREGKEGAMPTAMLIIGALLALIAVVGYLPNRLWAGDSGIEFARENRQMQKVADVVADITGPEDRRTVVAEMGLPDRDPEPTSSSLTNASVEASGKGIVVRFEMPKRKLKWESALLNSVQRATLVERDVLDALVTALPRVAERTGASLDLVADQASASDRADFEITWPPNRRILVDVRLQTVTALADRSRLGREAAASGERLGLLVLTADARATLKEALLMESGLRASIGGPVMVRPVGDAETIAGYLQGLVQAVESPG